MKQRNTIKVRLDNGGERELDLDLVTEFGSILAAPQNYFYAGRPEAPMMHLSGNRSYYVRIRPFGDYVFITKESVQEVAEALRREDFWKEGSAPPVEVRRAPGEPRTINETNCTQAKRLFKAGVSSVGIATEGHRITFQPIPLGRLWDLAHRLGIKTELSTELNTTEMIEALIVAIEDHYRSEEG